VLAKLEEYQLFCREEKCLFEKEEIEFLGVLLAQGTVKVSPRKVAAIRKEEPPTTRKGVHRFLGLTNYHQKFIRNYSSITRPLHDLTKDVKFDWNDQCQEAFDQLKTALSSAPVLALPGNEGKFWLETDASDTATGAVLYQQQSDQAWKLVRYHSKSYNDAKRNYTTYDKEMLAIMRGLEEWRSLLIGVRESFEIHTDHHNLMYFQEPQKLTSWQVNWTTKL
jgi:hypothetical protein